jgi:hypothetical protein
MARFNQLGRLLLAPHDRDIDDARGNRAEDDPRRRQKTKSEMDELLGRL